METHVKTFSELSAEELYRLLKARVDVFVVEQTCPYPELDNQDQKALHVWIEEDDEIVGVCRVLPKNTIYPEVSIGRVLSTKRNKGYGKAVFKAGLEVALKTFHADKIRLEAQTHARTFYESFGFEARGDTFLEDGIEYIFMFYEKRG